MAHLLPRHWTAIALAALLGWWALFYLPNTPAFAVFEFKRAVDAHDSERAAQFIDFESVVKHAGYEMVEDKARNKDLLSQFIGKGAVELFSKPVAGMAESWARREVATGAKEVQMPAAAVAGAIFLLHRNGDTAYTDFRDHKGQVWEIHMARTADGRWQVVEVKNIQQLLDRLTEKNPKTSP